MDETTIQMVINQTNYDRETVIKKLEEFDNDYMKFIKDYFGIGTKSNTNSNTNSKSLNQHIYVEFRKFFEPQGDKNETE